MNMEASAAVNKRARVTRFLRGAWRHALIDLFLVEIVVAVFFVTRLAVPVRPVRLDAADFPALTIHASSGSWPSQGLTLDTQEDITEYCELFNGLRAPKERHPDRYRIMGGATCSFVFKRKDGAALTISVTSGTPLFSVKETPYAAPQHYHVGEDVTARICADTEMLLHPDLGFK